MKNYSSIKPLVIEEYKRTQNMAGAARKFEINVKTVKAWIEKSEIEIKPTNLNVAGVKFGRLTALKHTEKDRFGKFIWRCECECGEFVDIRLNDLRSGKQKSCGCLRRENSQKVGRLNKGKVSPQRGENWYGDLSGKYYSQIRYSARKRNIEFNVSPKYLWELFVKQGEKCALSGLQIPINEDASVDRIDSGVGYIEGNIQWVHKHINNMKSNHKQEYFINMCEKIVLNTKKQKKDND